MTKKNLAKQVAAALETLYPDAVCSLEYEDEPWKLLILARLSAQCTDARVNIVAKTLFVRFPTLESVADCDLAALEETIKPCGLYKTKAKSIKETAEILVRDYGGRVPDTMDELLALPGVGRKIHTSSPTRTASASAGGSVFTPKARRIPRKLRKFSTAAWKSRSSRISATASWISGGTSARRGRRSAPPAPCSPSAAISLTRRRHTVDVQHHPVCGKAATSFSVPFAKK